jgi:RimJ/RimL family protein N-acetyltransferase
MLLSYCTDISRKDERGGGGRDVDGGAPSSRTREVVLRDVTEDDLAHFSEHQRDPVANRMADFPPRDRDAFRAHWKKILADESVTKKTILVEGRVAGNIVSFEQDGEREVGYWIGREFWSKGVATEALSVFLSHVEVRRPLHAGVAKPNIASIRVLEKCGFTVIGEKDEEYILRLTATVPIRRM